MSNHGDSAYLDIQSSISTVFYRSGGLHTKRTCVYSEYSGVNFRENFKLELGCSFQSGMYLPPLDVLWQRGEVC